MKLPYPGLVLLLIFTLMVSGCGKGAISYSHLLPTSLNEAFGCRGQSQFNGSLTGHQGAKRLKLAIQFITSLSSRLKAALSKSNGADVQVFE
jgi:hypothetical protein